MDQQDKVRNYYKLQAPIYDLTRWAFLFGRRRLPEWIRAVKQPKRILEIGCGTGANLAMLAKAFPEANLTGVDLSESMLQKANTNLRRAAGKRVSLIKAPFGANLFHEEENFDLILCSYSLSMMGDARLQCIREARHCLQPDGLFMVLDFLETPFSWFREWMEINHVNFDPQLLMECVTKHRSISFQKNQAYDGFWAYSLYTGTSTKQTVFKFNANFMQNPEQQILIS